MNVQQKQLLHRIRADPAEFRARLLIDVDGEAKPLASVVDPWQREDFEALDPAWRRVVGHRADGATQQAYLERPRGHSKTCDLAVMVTWALLASGRRLSGVAAAADQDQARLLRDAVAKLVQLNPWLRKFIEVKKDEVSNPETGSSLAILSSDAPGSYGLTPDFVIIDEITHWKSRDLWDSLFSAAAKRKNCLLLIIANAGFGQTWQEQLYRAVQRDPAWYFHRLDGPQASWITADRLAEQRRLLPDIAFRRLWLNVWTTGSGDALSEDDIQAALTLPGPLDGPEPGWVYTAGLDLGLSRDASALILIGQHVGHVEIEPAPPAPALPAAVRLLREAEGAADDLTKSRERVYDATGRLKLCYLKTWRPAGAGKVSIEQVEAAIAHLHKVFAPIVGCDPWQAAYLMERLRNQGVPTESVDFTGPNLKSMASATLEAFSERQIDLYDEPQLLADLRQLRAVEKSYGVRLESPRGPQGHGDSATALAIALHASKRNNWLAPADTNRPLVCWP